ncbi:MAG: hypothetical protein OYH77_06935 [Pseudomonadota bacterium]|nr:hypothetical protein [Pseudomonadota bacterium]
MADRYTNDVICITYFIGNGRTRSLKLKLVHLKLLLAAMAGLLLWSLLAVYLVAASVVDANEMNGVLRATKAALFSYQTRYDKVFENAYHTAQDASPAIANPTYKRLLTPRLQSNYDGWELELTQPRILVVAGEFTLQFNLKNSGKKAARGIIWALAKINTHAGEELNLPMNRASDKQQESVYRIKKQNLISLVFTPPPDSAGRIVALQVQLRDRARRTANFNFTLDIPYHDKPLTVSRSD